MSDALRASCFYSSLIAYHSSLSLSWQISAGELFELMLPASFALTVLLSTWVLASARRRRFNAALVTLWTLGTLLFPLIVLPLYLIASMFRKSQQRDSAEVVAENSAHEGGAPPLPWRRTLPALYLIVMLSLGALYFYRDSRSVDAHLMRANQARLLDKRERVIQEYRAALKLEDDAHTHNLLGRELMAAERWDEALTELRAAERMGEPDDELPYNIAEALYNLNRLLEAAQEYEKFLGGPLCLETPPDVRCSGVRQRLAEMAQGKPR